MRPPDYQHYKTNEGDPWFPQYMFRISGLIVDGDGATDTVCRSPATGTFLSVFTLEEAYPDDGLLLRFGEKTTEGGYIILTPDAVLDVCSQLTKSDFTPGWEPPMVFGRLSVPDDYTTEIDRREPESELHEKMCFRPVTSSPETGLEIAVPPRENKGAQIELTDPQMTVLTKLLETYLADPDALLGNSPKTTLIEPDGHEEIMSLTNYV